MAELVITFKNAGTYSFVAGATSTDVRLIGAGGAGGAAGTLGGGGGGGGGGFARTPDVSTTIGQTYNVVVGTGGVADGGDGVPTTFNGTTVVADSGKGGTNGTALGAGDPGAGGTNNTGSVTINGSAGSGTTGGTAAQTGIYPNGGTEGTAPGGGGGGGVLLGQGGNDGAIGIAVLAYTTGQGTATLQANYSKQLVLYRLRSEVIDLTATMVRRLVLSRGYTVSINLVSAMMYKVKLLRSSTTNLTVGVVKKTIQLLRSANTALVASVTKTIVLPPKIASIQLIAGFKRLVTLRRTFSASISLVANAWGKFPLKSLPSGGTTIVEKFKQIYMEWE